MSDKEEQQTLAPPPTKETDGERVQTERPSGGPRALVVELCRQLHALGWASGTGGGVSLLEGDRVYVSPSGLQNERLRETDVFELDLQGNVLAKPASVEATACSQLFLNAHHLGGAGAVLHSHGQNALMASLAFGHEFRVTHLEAMKGIAGLEYEDVLRVPIIENMADQAQLSESMALAMSAYPESHAVMIKRHGVYIWGKDWIQAKIHAECYDYLFEAAVRMRQLGLDPSAPPRAGDD